MNGTHPAAVQEPLVSVVIPSYNSAKTLGRALESVLSQSYRNIEVIVVDDGSTDGSADLAAAYKRVKVIRQENRGAGPARNNGLQHSSGKYVAFLDADDYWDEKCLATLVAAAEASAADIVYCGWQNVGMAGGRGEPFIPPDYENVEKSEVFLGGCRWPIHAALSRRSAIDDVNGFDERWTSCMDYDLWLRMATTHRIKLVPHVLAYYVHHEGEQITKNRYRGAVNHWNIQRKFLSEHPEVERNLGRDKIRAITYGELLRRAYVSYWGRDLDTAHRLFRIVMQGGYGKLADWKYIIPAILPLTWYRGLVDRVDRCRKR
jgi:glycosyltransferase involved in cell wall biosynthesis